MSGAEVQAAYFTPFHFLIYLVIVFAIMVAYYQWQWAKKTTKFIKVLVVKPDGSTDTEYAPKTGNYVALKMPESNSIRLWPINKLSAIDMLYPGDGFIPNFLQKKIKTVIVDVEDWEPMLNRGSYSRQVASPDVVRVIRDLAEDYPDAKDDLTSLADGLSTAPTRDMVASPAVLGNIMKEKVSELAVTISRDTFDKMEGMARKLDKVPNPMILYIGLGALAIGIIIIIVNVLPGMGDTATMQADINAIKRALGIP